MGQQTGEGKGCRSEAACGTGSEGGEEETGDHIYFADIRWIQVSNCLSLGRRQLAWGSYGNIGKSRGSRARLLGTITGLNISDVLCLLSVIFGGLCAEHVELCLAPC